MDILQAQLALAAQHIFSCSLLATATRVPPCHKVQEAMMNSDDRKVLAADLKTRGGVEFMADRALGARSAASALTPRGYLYRLSVHQ